MEPRTVKPYVEDVDGSVAGVPDAVWAAEAWRRYRLRNDSMVRVCYVCIYVDMDVCVFCL